MTRVSETFGVPTDKEEDTGLVAEQYVSPDDVELTMEDIYSCLGLDGKEFIDCMVVVQAIIDDPRDFIGNAGALEAARLAGLRTKIGTKVQYYKTAAKSVVQRKRKDQLFSMYHSLEENINTLKLLARIEHG